MKARHQNNSKIMRNLILMGLLSFCSITGFSQSAPANTLVVTETTKLENVSITATVDSAEDIESTFKVEDLKEVFEDLGANETLSFEIICNGKKMPNGVKSHVSYKIDGNSNDAEGFLKRVEKIRSAAIKYYNNKA